MTKFWMRFCAAVALGLFNGADVDVALGRPTGADLAGDSGLVPAETDDADVDVESADDARESLESWLLV